MKLSFKGLSFFLTKRKKIIMYSTFFIAVFIFISLIPGCEENPADGGKTLYYMDIHIVSGNNQTIKAGGVESAPLVVRIQDSFSGSPYSGTTVVWKISKGEGTLSSSTNTTNSNGESQITYVSGETTGEVVITTTVDLTSSGGASKPPTPVDFNVTIVE